MTALNKLWHAGSPARVLFVVAVVLGIAWFLVELLSTGVQKWSMNHPVAVTLLTGLILLVLTVLGVERWLAWNESRRWRVPAFAALEALVTRGLALRQHIQWEYYKLAGIKEEFSPDIMELPVTETVDQMMSTGSFFAFASVVRDALVELATLAMVAGQTVSRYEPLAHLVPTIFSSQKHLSALAQDASLLATGPPPPTYPVTTPDDYDVVFDERADFAEETAKEMEAEFSEFGTAFGDLNSQLIYARQREPSQPGGVWPWAPRSGLKSNKPDGGKGAQ